MKSDEARGRWKTERKSQKPAGGTRDRRASSCPRIGRSILPRSPLAPAKVSLLCIIEKERVVIDKKKGVKEEEEMTSITVEKCSLFSSSYSYLERP